MPQNKIIVQTLVDAPIEKVWAYWNEPEHISGWAFASDTWEAINEVNEVRAGGVFKTRMQAKDKSAGFDFAGVYTQVKENELIEYDLDDNRHVSIVFTQTPQGVELVQTFDPENENSQETQRAGWQAFLDNFKQYTENH